MSELPQRDVEGNAETSAHQPEHRKLMVRFSDDVQVIRGPEFDSSPTESPLQSRIGSFTRSGSGSAGGVVINNNAYDSPPSLPILDGGEREEGSITPEMLGATAVFGSDITTPPPAVKLTQPTPEGSSANQKFGRRQRQPPPSSLLAAVSGNACNNGMTPTKSPATKSPGANPSRSSSQSPLSMLQQNTNRSTSSNPGSGSSTPTYFGAGTAVNTSGSWTGGVKARRGSQDSVGGSSDCSFVDRGSNAGSSYAVNVASGLGSRYSPTPSPVGVLGSPGSAPTSQTNFSFGKSSNPSFGSPPKDNSEASSLVMSPSVGGDEGSMIFVPSSSSINGTESGRNPTQMSQYALALQSTSGMGKPIRDILRQGYMREAEIASS